MAPGADVKSRPMNLDFAHLDAWGVKLAGVAGALVSMKFLSGTLSQRLTSAASGVLLSYYAAPTLSHKIAMPEGLAGFLLGLFGMAIVSRAWEFVQDTPIATIWAAAIDRIRGRKGDSNV